MTKVAVGCRSLAQLQTRQASRIGSFAGTSTIPCITRFLPKRTEELVGGSLYWIIRHALVARQTIINFEEVKSERGRQCHIHLAPEVVPVLAMPLRAHQGWRYLDCAAAPPDLDTVGGDVGALPLKLMRDLRALGLI